MAGAAAKKATAKAADAPEPAGADMPEVCAEHFPNGWPSEDMSAIGCEHGSWTHPNFVPPEPDVVELGDAAEEADAAAEGDEDAPKF